MRVKGRQRELRVTSLLRCDAAGEKNTCSFRLAGKKMVKKKNIIRFILVQISVQNNYANENILISEQPSRIIA